MPKVKFPYGKQFIEYDIPQERLRAVLVSKLQDYPVPEDGNEVVLKAMENPIGSQKLCRLAEGKQKIVIIASDHTRPVPSRFIIPHMLKEIRLGNPSADITILIATGCHRGTTKTELVEKFGEEIVRNEKIEIHDCLDEKNLAHIGTLPSGGECVINRIAYEADLLLAEGFIEPHFFAGFSGGRKSVLPGIAGRRAVLANHCSEFIADEHSRTGILEGNPLHTDMLWAARTAGLKYIVNVIINEKKEIVHAVAGELEAAHSAGCKFLKKLCAVKAVPADIVITTNGGYPLDQNVYQSVKGMTAAEATVRRGGVIIMLARAEDGHGGEQFLAQMSAAENPEDITEAILKRGRNETLPDQWEAQVLCRVLSHATVIYVSDAPEDMVRAFHMHPAHSLPEAMKMAEEILGNSAASVTAVPDGISVMVLK